MTTCLVVRPASAGDRGTWRGDDRERPLDGRGRRQAAALVGQLTPLAASGRVISSPYVRCVETVEPLAAARRVAVEVSPALAEGAGLAILDLVREAGAGAVLCTHGDVLYDLLQHLARHGVIGGPAPLDKASTWVLQLDGEAVRSATHLPPPHAPRPGHRVKGRADS